MAWAHCNTLIVTLPPPESKTISVVDCRGTIAARRGFGTMNERKAAANVAFCVHGKVPLMSNDQTTPMAAPQTAHRLHGGTIINVITAVVFFGLIAFGVLWVIKQVGQATQQYGEVMVTTADRASALKCQMNMRSIYQSLQLYALADGTFPSSQRELVDYCGDSRLFRCNEPNAPTYVYLAPPRGAVPPTNVLLYEPVPVHEGRSTVLFANGQIALLAPDELEKAIDATLANLRQGG